MSVEPVTYYVAICDGCGANDDDGEYSAFSDEGSALDHARGGDWLGDYAFLICDSCYRDYAAAVAPVECPEFVDEDPLRWLAVKGWARERRPAKEAERAAKVAARFDRWASESAARDDEDRRRVAAHRARLARELAAQDLRLYFAGRLAFRGLPDVRLFTRRTSAGTTLVAEQRFPAALGGYHPIARASILVGPAALGGPGAEVEMSAAALHFQFGHLVFQERWFIAGGVAALGGASRSLGDDTAVGNGCAAPAPTCQRGVDA